MSSSGQALEHFHGELGRATGAHGTIVQRARLLLGQLHELFQGVDMQAAGHHQHVRAGGHQGDRCQIGEGIVAQRLAIQHRRGGQRAIDREQHRVAVRLGLGGQAGADVAAGARLVLHDDGLAQRLRKRLRHDAGQQVGRGAGREGHDQVYGALRPFRMGGRAGRQGGGKTGQGQPQPGHARRGGGGRTGTSISPLARCAIGRRAAGLFQVLVRFPFLVGYAQVAAFRAGVARQQGGDGRHGRRRRRIGPRRRRR